MKRSASRKSFCQRLTVLIASSISSIATAQSPSLSNLEKAISPDTNAVAIFDYTSLKTSSFATKNKITAGDFISMPPSTKYAAIVAEVDFDYWSSDSHLGFVALSKKTSFRDAVTNERMIVDSAGDQRLIWTAEQTSVSDFADGSFIVLPRRNRQQATRRMRQLYADQSLPIDSYFLRKALKRAKVDNVFFTLAMDLGDAISPSSIERHVLAETDFTDESERAEARKLLAGIQGIVITVRTTDELTAAVEMEFKSDAAMLKDRGAKVFNRWLDNYGARISQLSAWNTEVDGNRVTISGPISIDTLKDITSLAIQDTAVPETARKIAREFGEKPSGDSSGSGIGSQNATVQFMSRVKELLSILQSKAIDQPSRSRFWIDRCALRIQYLDRDLVDDNALRFADRTTSQLRLMSEILENASTSVEQYEDAWTLGFAAPSNQRTITYGAVPIRRRAFLFAGGNLALNFALSRRQADERLDEAASKAKQIGLEVVADFNSTGRTVADKYDIPFTIWSPYGG